MAINIDTYRYVASSRGKTVNLSKSRDALQLGSSTRLGRMASWLRGFRASQNAKVRQHFLSALALHYGEGASEHLLSDTSLNFAARKKKALTSYEVNRALFLADRYRSDINAQNVVLSTQYSTPTTTTPSLLDYKLSQVLSKLTAAARRDTDSASDKPFMDMQSVRQFIDMDAIGRKVQRQIQAKGDSGKHFVTQDEANAIAKQVIRDAVVDKYKEALYDQYLLPSDQSHSQLAAQIESRHGITLDTKQLDAETIATINAAIKRDLDDAIYKGGVTQPSLLSEDQVADIVERRLQTVATVQALPIPEASVKAQLQSFVQSSAMSPSQLNAFLGMRAHIKVLADADQAAADALKTALNGFNDAVAQLSSGSENKSSRIDAGKAMSLLTTLAQNDEQPNLAEKLHHQITQPGPFNSYIKALHHYRVDFSKSEACHKQQDFYQPSLQRAKEFGGWIEALALATSEDGQGMWVDSDYPQSLSDIDDQTVRLMRNTGIKVPTPSRVNQQGEGSFSDEALAYMERELAIGTPDPREEDGISQQFIRDMEVRSAIYFNGKKASEGQVVAQYKAFCTDKDGQLNEDMLFGLSQIHQGTLGVAYLACKYEQLAPVWGMFVGPDDTANYYFDKGEDGTITVRAESGKSKPIVFASLPSANTVDLDPEKSNFFAALEVRFTPDQFTADREKFPPPKLTDATYQYSLYTAENE